jgi:hypothetical protein
MPTANYLPVAKRIPNSVGLSLSGGGFRATLFHLGAIRRLNEFGILPKITTISSVSGGSILNGFLASRLPAPLSQGLADFDRDASGPRARPEPDIDGTDRQVVSSERGGASSAKVHQVVAADGSANPQVGGGHIRPGRPGERNRARRQGLECDGHKSPHSLCGQI